MQRDGREDDENVVFHLLSVQFCRAAVGGQLLPSNSTPLLLRPASLSGEEKKKSVCVCLEGGGIFQFCTHWKV